MRNDFEIGSSLIDLYAPVSVTQTPISDPLNGNTIELATVTSGGNPKLKAETGQSRTVGIVYKSVEVPGLQVAITYWSINENNSVQNLDSQTIVNNESLFPNNVTRGPPGPNGQPGVVTEVNSQFVNFGEIDVAGLDYQASYTIAMGGAGELSGTVSATETYRYRVAFQPGLPAIDYVSKANDAGGGTNWAPRWKGTAAVGWKLGPYAASVDGRYVGRYLDYQDVPNANELGNFWLFDINCQYAVGSSLKLHNPYLRGTYLEAGAVNVLNRLPQFSNYSGGAYGFDPTQADIRGRFLYGQIGVKW